MLECKQCELEYLATFKTRKSPSPPPDSGLLKMMKIVTIPSEEPGLVLEEFGKALPKDGESEEEVKRIYGDQSITAALVTDIYLAWVARDRNTESEGYLKTLTGKSAFLVLLMYPTDVSHALSCTIRWDIPCRGLTVW